MSATKDLYGLVNGCNHGCAYLGFGDVKKKKEKKEKEKGMQREKSNNTNLKGGE